MRDLILLLNLDAVASRSMARRLRGEGVYCKIMPPWVTGDTVAAEEASGLILAGGTGGTAPFVPHLADILRLHMPVLAMGDAALMLCEHMGGALLPQMGNEEVRQVAFTKGHTITADVQDGERFFDHFRPMKLPENCVGLADSEGEWVGFACASADLYAFAFQPEANDPDGTQLLMNFCLTICNCTRWWNSESCIQLAKEQIQSCAAQGDALCAISGGLDSTVCAVIGQMALGNRLHCVLIDSGLLRLGEREEVRHVFEEVLHLPLEVVDISQAMLSALENAATPQEKERAVHHTMTDALQSLKQRYPNAQVLIQGTNYADTLERSQKAQEDQPEGFLLCEPLKELFKDEIRQVAQLLFLPEEQIYRQPFPGTGLALRITAQVTAERLTILREADAIFREEIEAASLQKRLWQYFAYLAETPIPADGGALIILRAVQAIDQTYAMPARLPYDLLERVTERIITQMPQVRRVLYDQTPSSNFSRIEWR